MPTSSSALKCIAIIAMLIFMIVWVVNSNSTSLNLFFTQCSVSPNNILWFCEEVCFVNEQVSSRYKESISQRQLDHLVPRKMPLLSILCPAFSSPNYPSKNPLILRIKCNSTSAAVKNEMLWVVYNCLEGVGDA